MGYLFKHYTLTSIFFILVSTIGSTSYALTCKDLLGSDLLTEVQLNNRSYQALKESYESKLINETQFQIKKGDLLNQAMRDFTEELVLQIASKDISQVLETISIATHSNFGVNFSIKPEHAIFFNPFRRVLTAVSSRTSSSSVYGYNKLNYDIISHLVRVIESIRLSLDFETLNSTLEGYDVVFDSLSLNSARTHYEQATETILSSIIQLTAHLDSWPANIDKGTRSLLEIVGSIQSRGDLLLIEHMAHIMPAAMIGRNGNLRYFNTPLLVFDENQQPSISKEFIGVLKSCRAGHGCPLARNNSGQPSSVRLVLNALLNKVIESL